MSFIEAARRGQIVACAIETIATLGYARASLAEVAKRAGISKSVISYHFAGKDELIREVVTEVYSLAISLIVPRIQAAPDARGALRAYIEGHVACSGPTSRATSPSSPATGSTCSPWLKSSLVCLPRLATFRATSQVSKTRCPAWRESCAEARRRASSARSRRA